MSHRQKHAHRSRHHTHTKKPSGAITNMSTIPIPAVAAPIGPAAETAAVNPIAADDTAVVP